MKKLITLTAIFALVSTASFAQDRDQQYDQYSYQKHAGYGDRDDHHRRKHDRDRDRDDRYRGDRDRDDHYRGDRDRDDRYRRYEEREERRERRYENKRYKKHTPLAVRVVLGNRRYRY